MKLTHGVLGHLLVRLLIRLHRSLIHLIHTLIRLPRTVCFASAIRCAHSLINFHKTAWNYNDANLFWNLREIASWAFTINIQYSQKHIDSTNIFPWSGQIAGENKRRLDSVLLSCVSPLFPIVSFPLLLILWHWNHHRSLYFCTNLYFAHSLNPFWNFIRLTKPIRLLFLGCHVQAVHYLFISHLFNSTTLDIPLRRSPLSAVRSYF